MSPIREEPDERDNFVSYSTSYVDVGKAAVLVYTMKSPESEFASSDGSMRGHAQSFAGVSGLRVALSCATRAEGCQSGPSAPVHACFAFGQASRRDAVWLNIYLARWCVSQNWSFNCVRFCHFTFRVLLETQHGSGAVGEGHSI